MTRLLEEAFARVSELPADAQDELARWLLSELESERRWSESTTTRIAGGMMKAPRRGLQ
jgi:hypothetical protein